MMECKPPVYHSSVVLKSGWRLESLESFKKTSMLRPHPKKIVPFTLQNYPQWFLREARIERQLLFTAQEGCRLATQSAAHAPAASASLGSRWRCRISGLTQAPSVSIVFQQDPRVTHVEYWTLTFENKTLVNPKVRDFIEYSPRTGSEYMGV